MTSVPARFDWVNARQKCNPATLFASIRSVVEADVNRRNQQLENEAFVVTETRTGFTVTQPDPTSDRELACIAFRLSGSEISVVDSSDRHDRKELLRGRAYLQGDGNCTLDAEGRDKPMHPWEISRYVLEDVLF